MKNDKYVRTLRTVDLTAGDYTGDTAMTATELYFGIFLAADATVKFTDMTGHTDTIALTAGYHPLQLSKIFKTGTSVTSIVIFY